MPLTDDDSDPSQDLPALPEVAGFGDTPARAPALANGPPTTPGTVVAADALPALPEVAALDASAPRGDIRVEDGEHSDPTQRAIETPAVAVDVLLGRTFGGYQITSRIGAGGMGVVYKGRQVSLDRVVAIKILNKALIDNDEFIKRFEREAKSIARITHANIVAVYDFGQIDGIYYMVTEFIEGSNLARMIGDKLMLSLDEMLPLVVNCLDGLHHVSASGIIHRDIKPDNILITTDKIAKIADFGLAKNVTDDTDLTAVGLAMGTPAYMSPEQCMGRRLDVRSDLYALGVTTYFALTGEKPFTGQSSFEIMTKQREFTPPPPSQLNPRIHKDASALVMRMLAKNPQDRFRDADDCRKAWCDLGVRIGVYPSTRSSSEINVDLTSVPGGPTLRATGELPAMPALPAANAPAAGLRPPTLATASSISAAGLRPPTHPGSSSAGGLRPPTHLPHPPTGDLAAVGSERRERSDVHRAQRSGTDRRGVRTPASGEPTTCAKCGMLNRGGISACQRCGAVLNEPVFDAREHEQLGDRQMSERRFADAAKTYGRLAEQEADRKLRSVWRSKEREARERAQDVQVDEIDGRSRSLVESGDLKAGLDVLERGLREVRDAGGGTDAETRLSATLDALRRRVSSRRRARVIAALVVLILVITATAFMLHSQQRPVSARTAVSAP